MTWRMLLFIVCTIFALQPFSAQAGVCDVTWDGEKLASFARSRGLSEAIPLLGLNKSVKAQVTARQVLAFVEAKDAVTQQIGRSAKLVVCSNEEPNAFATKNSYGDVVGVTVGMLKMLDGDRDASAMVVGHEFAHFELNHMAASKGRDTILELLGFVAGVVLETKIQRNTGVHGAGFDLANLGAMLVSRKFDRDQEREADELGFLHMIAAGFNPNGAVRLAERMSSLNKSAGLFFDTHPGWYERADLMRQFIANSELAKTIIAKTGDKTQLTSTQEQGHVIASLVPLYVSTDADKSFADAIESFTQKDISTGIVHLRAAAAAGHSRSQVALGHMMLTGRNGVPKDEIEAVRLFREAAVHGDSDAVNNLGFAAARGIGGVTKDPVEALNYYKKAVELGSGLAAKNIGDGYGLGISPLARDQIEALRYYRKSDELGYPDGTAAVGLFYEYGEAGIVKNIDTAADYYQRSALNGSPLGRYRLGLLKVQGIAPIPKDEQVGVGLIRQAAMQNLPSAQNDLGTFYQHGAYGTVKNDVEAVKWYRLSAEQGFLVAQANLGHMYLQGWGGLFKDATEAGRWFKLAADQGSPQGEHGLGLLKEFGEGGYSKDKDAAIELYRKAASKGLKPAVERLQKLGL